jgi:hypothetical protein
MVMVLRMRRCSAVIVEVTSSSVPKTKRFMRLKVLKTNQFVVPIAVIPRNSAWMMVVVVAVAVAEDVLGVAETGTVTIAVAVVIWAETVLSQGRTVGGNHVSTVVKVVIWAETVLSQERKEVVVEVDAVAVVVAEEVEDAEEVEAEGDIKKWFDHSGYFISW